MNKDKLLKVARLAVDGEPGEREAARFILTRQDLHSKDPSPGDETNLTDDEIAEIIGMAESIRQATLGKGLLNG